ncbi:hypothetical protein ARMGADRAFT_1024265 [Armillaria gallica]|uniref:Alcohol dehydrogenase-like C-terminal domain-containing protein n=1 Tax=Armillaria gallica TaxID=47427 RepID=A0A2H3DYH2_ARMGA|nr:hypothetical protein ARMGADRAFT_1024265 [Armillaria gallica]
MASLGATATIDYHSPSLAEDVANAAGGDGEVALAVDCITAEGTIAKVAKVISQMGTVALLLPIKEGNNVRGEGDAPMYREIYIRKAAIRFPRVSMFTNFHWKPPVKDAFQKENVMPWILPELLEKGIILPDRIHLLDQGTFKERVAVGLDLLRHNKIFATLRMFKAVRLEER